MKRSIEWLDDWLRSVGTDPTLRRALVKYALGRGVDSMKDSVFEEERNHRDMKISQDCIGWRRFMEGMILKETVKLQQDFIDLGGCSISLDKWAQGLILRLLEITHGQWIYRNMHVYDAIAGMEATARKEEIRRFLEDELEMREEGLDERDHYLLESSLGDLKTSTG